MKNAKKYFYIVTFGIAPAIILLIALFFFIKSPKPEFNGSRVRGEEQYYLDFTILNGIQTHTMSFDVDDKLECKFSIEKGIVDVFIVKDNGEKLYQGNNVDEAEFILTVKTAGSYKITVNGEDARGSIDIHKVK